MFPVASTIIGLMIGFAAPAQIDGIKSVNAQHTLVAARIVRAPRPPRVRRPRRIRIRVPCSDTPGRGIVNNCR